MAVSVMNNAGTALALGELNKNITKVGELLAKVSSGMKISGAKDDSAQFAISELMRVKIRALNQANQNVQNGGALLRTAEEAIQQQIDLMRTIKEKVIDAANDTNTDDDRRIIQKEINQFYDQIEQTAYYTDYNTQKPLIGNVIRKEIIEKVPYLEETVQHLQPNDPGFSADMNIIRDVYMTLDGITGPFDKFEDYEIGNTSIKPLGIDTALEIKPNGDDYVATPYEYAYTDSDSQKKITSWANAADSFMNNRGFYVYDSNNRTYNYYVLTNNPGSNTYRRSNVTEIDISGCSTVSQVMEKIDNELDGVTKHSGNKLTIEKEYTLYGFEEFKPRKASTASAASFSGGGKLSGAVYAQKWVAGSSGSGDASGGSSGYWTKDYSNSRDGSVSGSVNISQLNDNTGFTVKDSSGNEVGCVRFVNGPLYRDDDTTKPAVGHQMGDDGVPEISISYLRNGGSVSLYTGNITVSVSSTGSITVSSSPYSTTDASDINGYKVSNGISAGTGTNDVRVRSLYFEKQAAEATIDLTKYKTTDNAKLESFISGIAGKALKDNSGYTTPGITYSNNPYTNSSNGYYYEFIDSKSSDADKNKSKILYNFDSIYHNVGVTVLDLDVVRNYVRNSNMTIADAFANFLKNHTGSENVKDDNGNDVLDANGNVKTNGRYFPATYYVDGDETSGVKSVSIKAMNITNYDSAITPVQGIVRHYDLDFNDWFNEHDDLVHYNLVSEYIDGKGFRAFCATDSTEWFNFIYRNGKENFVDEDFETGTAVIHTIQIDVSNVKSAADLANAIYKQAEPELKNVNHKLHLKLGKSGVVSIYDERPLSNNFLKNINYSGIHYENFQTGSPGTYMNGADIGENLNSGAKIADGIIEEDKERDRLGKVLRYYDNPHTKLLARKFIIQDTDHADMNLRITIPQTTLSNIFYPLPEDDEPYDFKDSIYNYNIISKENRDLLLGDEWADPPREGFLDRGINYLLDAVTTIGAQRARLEYDQKNIVEQVENVMASESTIRDADMAKEMTEYTKYNVISQASQSILAQANQNLSQVLSLLQ